MSEPAGPRLFVTLPETGLGGTDSRALDPPEISHTHRVSHRSSGHIVCDHLNFVSASWAAGGRFLPWHERQKWAAYVFRHLVVQ